MERYLDLDRRLLARSARVYDGYARLIEKESSDSRPSEVDMVKASSLVLAAAYGVLIGEHYSSGRFHHDLFQLAAEEYQELDMPFYGVLSICGDFKRLTLQYVEDMSVETREDLSDLPVQYKVQNFNNENQDKIFQRWSGIKRSIEAAVDLANTFGIDRDTLTSRNALIPLAYYFLLHDLKLRSNSAFDVKNAATVRKWLTTALLNNVFGGASDNVLRDIREVLKAQGELTADFPADEISKVIERRGRAAYVNDGTVDELLSITYGGRNAFLALSLLYEGNNWGTMTFHQDHIFPRALFSERNLNALGFDEVRKDRYRGLRDRFGNLQLLLSDENLEKQDKNFGDWIRTRDKGFKQRHLIPEDDGLLDFGRFEQFMSAREDLIRKHLKNLLYVEQSR
jgi:hypothetical protein